jgi:hypothetical protein
VDANVFISGGIRSKACLKENNREGQIYKRRHRQKWARENIHTNNFPTKDEIPRDEFLFLSSLHPAASQSHFRVCKRKM